MYQISRRRTAFAKPFVWWIREPLDVAAMRNAAAVFVGKKDFSAFTDDDPEEKSTLVLIEGVEIVEAGALVLIRIQGSHFLWKMVRGIVGVLAAVGRGDLEASAAEALLAGPDTQSSSTPPAALTAPAAGLFLEGVYYTGDRGPGPLRPLVVIQYLQRGSAQGFSTGVLHKGSAQGFYIAVLRAGVLRRNYRAGSADDKIAHTPPGARSFPGTSKSHYLRDLDSAVENRHSMCRTPCVSVRTGLAGFACAAAVVVVSAAPPPVLTEPLTGRQVFPTSNWWNLDISGAPVDPDPAIHQLDQRSHGVESSAVRQLHPDFGLPPYGIPYVVVAGDQPRVPVTFDYNDESDAGAPGLPGYPIPDEARTQPHYIEGDVPGRIERRSAPARHRSRSLASV